MRLSPTRFVHSLTLGLLVSGCSSDPAAVPAPEPDEVAIRGFAFTPSTRTVPAGTRVTWINQDNADHTATGGANTDTWDSGRLAENRTFSRTFDTPGTYPYTCAIHPEMHGIIVVQ